VGYDQAGPIMDNLLCNLDTNSRRHNSVQMLSIARLSMILAILVCPMNCMGSASADTSAPSDIDSCCGHNAPRGHNAPAGASQHDAPRSPGDDDSECPNCVCRGAVSGPGQVELDRESAVEIAFNHASLVDKDLRKFGSSCDRASDPLTSSSSTGRAMRILNQSFLI